MEPKNKLRFAVDDQLYDRDVGPSHVSLSLLGEFQKDVSEFLRGSNKEVDPSKVVVSIEEGSLAFIASGLLTASSLWNDLSQLERSNSLDAIDKKRALVIARWQSIARSHPHRKYKLADSTGRVLLTVHAGTDLRSVDNLWVRSEKYLLGRITDMGGKSRPNIHIEINGGQLVKVSASQDQLAEGEKNRMYRDELLHVLAEENLLTGELRNMSLIGFESYQPRYEEDEFRRMIDRGTKAWSEVDDDWLEKLRGGNA